MDWKKSMFAVGMLMVLVLTACSPSLSDDSGAGETPTEEMMDEPTPMMTEEGAAQVTEEAMAEDTEAPMVEAEPSVMLAATGLGEILVDPAGMTLYMFANDGPDESACYDSCATAWPPLLVDGQPVAGEGLDASLLGTTERTDGTVQLTYNGMPLYFYAQDSASGDAKGQGVGGVWYVVDAAGDAVTAAGEDLPDY